MRSRATARTAPSSIDARAKQTRFPKFIEPNLATLRDTAPSGSDWLHEVKFDGYRVQAHYDAGKTAIYTRRGYDWSDRFGNIAQALATLAARQLVLDGEIIVPDERGASDYHKLQEDLARRRTDRFVYFAFDLLYLDGYDLRGVPLVERKRTLARLLDNAPPQIRYSDHFETQGSDVFEKVCEMRLEGIVSKRADSTYRSGRNDNWIKTKCVKSDTYPIVAFVEKLGAKPRRVASLYIGRREGDRLLYAGKVRTGYTETIARELRETLDPLIRKSSPLTEPIDKPKATWVEPLVEAEVSFSSITADGLLREAVYKGMRERADMSVPSTARVRKATQVRVPKENILQLLPDAVPPSRERLAGYWQRVAKQALEHLGRRPLKLVRHTRDTTFYHKGRLPPLPRSVHQLKIEKREGGEGTRVWVDDVEGLLGLVEIGAVELHPWNSTVNDIERADVLVFDFDPGAGVEYEFVIASALAMRELLRREGLSSWPKLTGGKGIHVMVPLGDAMPHDEAHAYAKRLAQQLAATAPKRYILSAAKSARAGRLFIDYLRNGRGTTAIGTYSPRASAGFPIAAPATWKEIEAGVRPNAYTMERPPKRRPARKP